MSDIGKQALKTKINSKVYENSSQAITGAAMNEVLQDMVDTLCDGANLDAGSVTDSRLQNPVSVSQNSQTGHTDITIGDTTTPVASVEDVSQLGQKISKVYCKGKGSTAFRYDMKGLLPNHTYRFYLSKLYAHDNIGSTGAGFSIIGWTGATDHNYVFVSVANISTLKTSYDVTINSTYDDLISIIGRANQDEEFFICIEDVTMLSELKTDIVNKYNELVDTIVINGNGSSLVNYEVEGLIPNHSYRLYLKSTPWELPSLPDNNTILGAVWYLNATEIELLSVTYAQRASIKDYYEISLPNNFEGTLKLIARASAGESIVIKIEDVTCEILNKDLTYFVGKGTTVSTTEYRAVKAGRRYRIVFPINDWNVPTTLTPNQSVIFIVWYNGSTEIEIMSVPYSRQAQRPPYYDFELPSAFANSNGSIVIGGRAIKDNNVYFYIYDITEEYNLKVLQYDNDRITSKVINSYKPYRHNPTVGGKIVLCHFSDIHGNTEGIKDIKRFVAKYVSYIDDVIHTGDTAGGSYGEGASGGAFWSDNGVQKYLNLIGNHDVTTGETQQDTYNAYIKPYISQWTNVHQPDNAETNGLCYWYKDYLFIRVIALDSMHIDSAQVTWFRNVLADAKSQGLKVVVVAHIAPQCDDKVECNFSSLDYDINYGDGEIDNSGFVSAIDEFIADEGEFICWLVGHGHSDNIMYVKDAVNAQLVIAIECAVDDSSWIDGGHVAGFNCNTAFNLITFETITNVIKIARFGNEYDHYLRHKGTLCYDYVNKTLITQS